MAKFKIEESTEKINEYRPPFLNSVANLHILSLTLTHKLGELATLGARG